MTIGAGEDTEDLDGSDHRGTGLAEFVALSLYVVEGFVILGAAAALANQAQYGGQDLSVEGAHAWATPSPSRLFGPRPMPSSSPRSARTRRMDQDARR